MRDRLVITSLLIVIIIVAVSIRVVVDVDSPSLADSCNDATGFSLYGWKWGSFPITYQFVNVSNDLILSNTVKAFNIWDDLTPVSLFEEVFSLPHIVIETVDTMLFTYIARVNYTVFVDTDDTSLIKTVQDGGGTLTYNEFYNFEELSFSCDIVSVLVVRGSVVDILSVALHEIGHILGLDHYNNIRLTMHGYMGSYGQTLADGDIEGFYMLYPKIDHNQSSSYLNNGTPNGTSIT